MEKFNPVHVNELMNLVLARLDTKLSLLEQSNDNQVNEIEIISMHVNDIEIQLETLGCDISPPETAAEATLSDVIKNYRASKELETSIVPAINGISQIKASSCEKGQNSSRKVSARAHTEANNSEKELTGAEMLSLKGSHSEVATPFSKSRSSSTFSNGKSLMPQIGLFTQEDPLFNPEDDSFALLEAKIHEKMAILQKKLPNQTQPPLVIQTIKPDVVIKLKDFMEHETAGLKDPAEKQSKSRATTPKQRVTPSQSQTKIVEEQFRDTGFSQSAQGSCQSNNTQTNSKGVSNMNTNPGYATNGYFNLKPSKILDKYVPFSQRNKKSQPGSRNEKKGEAAATHNFQDKIDLRDSENREVSCQNSPMRKNTVNENGSETKENKSTPKWEKMNNIDESSKLATVSLNTMFSTPEKVQVKQSPTASLSNTPSCQNSNQNPAPNENLLNYYIKSSNKLII